jgi:hypothetical protein
VLVFAVVSAETEHAVELFIRREDAERFLEEVRSDDAELADRLRAGADRARRPTGARRRRSAFDRSLRRLG